ncbi:MAG: hypothetical protein HS116_12535 [Planctomycetes bacterium]|nr:hypothetical protein [Planctomycetota bacterium]
MVTHAHHLPETESTSRPRTRVIKGGKVVYSHEPRQLLLPGTSCDPRLTVEKENGIVKSFRYRCTCGHTDHFICQ